MEAAKMVSAKILIVETERIVALDLKNILHECGYSNTELAFTADEALCKLSLARPDIMLIDESLGTTFEGRRIGRKVNRELKIPVIYLSSRNSATLQKTDARAEGCAYVAKPFSYDDISRSISKVLHDNRPRYC
jgi:two-component system, response regulator PdtaR